MFTVNSVLGNIGMFNNSQFDNYFDFVQQLKNRLFLGSFCACQWLNKTLIEHNLETGFSLINVFFNFFSTCHWSNKTLIELNPVSKLCSINVLFDFCPFQVRLGQVRNFFSQKRDFLPVEITLFWIVKQNPVEHPTSILSFNIGNS